MSGLKTPKGTADELPREAFLYEEIIEKIRKVFVVHGASPISTPTFEMRSILVNKYGDDSKLIYDLSDQGGEICSLRYDLTVPFARFLASKKIRRMKRYQIGKVYRRDQPSAAKGRLREFVQADFDIAGECIPMMADAEVISCVDKILRVFEIGEFVIKVNDRRILTSILEMIGVAEEDYSSICSTIDKLDKMSVDELRKEFMQKGLSECQVLRIEEYMRQAGNSNVLEYLENDAVGEIARCREAICSMKELFRLCKILGCDECLAVDISLARGLDYYTGMIIEAGYIGKQVGSVIGGGRYDNLTENLGVKGMAIACVGFSVGVSRIFSMLCEQYCKESATVVYVGASGGLFLDERLSIIRMLWDAGIPSETFYTKRSSFDDQVAYARKRGVPIVVVVGESEIASKSVQMINLATNEKRTILIEDAVGYIKEVV
ncbi:histidyl-tRNA synthetase [Ordospora pajunii]|uniref:histidyl-tRNA synthetase n=1 Tax=Ordospora pajunii TaxID=3039483 RepID=UPI00295271D9|nr:histidyl-tRNA synthetase [Ordospora pajunii]KAH9411269.1 histidyl-tRNA synthetase [Ordospora pajunii]